VGDWPVVIATIVGCYALKLAGYYVPEPWLAGPGVRRFVELVPVALLSALVVVEALAQGRHIDLDGPRLAGVAAAAVLVWRRALFPVVVLAAAVVAVLFRHL
jgi:branched-subunit amino acid transport protein